MKIWFIVLIYVTSYEVIDCQNNKIQEVGKQWFNGNVRVKRTGDWDECEKKRIVNY